MASGSMKRLEVLKQARDKNPNNPEIYLKLGMITPGAGN